MSKDQRVRTSLSKQQWRLIESNMPDKDRKKIKQEIVNQLLIIDKLCEDLPPIEPCESCSEERKFSLPPKAWAAIRRIKSKTGIKDPSTVISKFVIHNILIKKASC